MKYVGLPRLNAYPLNTVPEIEMSIRNINYCPKGNILELTNNINKRLRELRTKVDCYEQYKSYIDRSFVANYFPENTTKIDLATTVDKMASELKIKLKKSAVSIVKGINIQNIDQKVEDIRTVVSDTVLIKELERRAKQENGDEIVKFASKLYWLAHEIDIAHNIIHNNIIIGGVNDNQAMECTYLMIDIIRMHKDILKEKTAPRKYLMPFISEIIKCLNTVSPSITAKLLYVMLEEVNIYGESPLFTPMLTEKKDSIYKPNPTEIYDVLGSANETERFLNTNISAAYKNIRSFTLGCRKAPLIKSFNDYLYNHGSYQFETIFDRLSEDRIRTFIPTFTFVLKNVQLLMLQESNAFDTLYQWIISNDHCYIGQRGDELFIIGADTSKPNQFISISLTNINKLCYGVVELPFKRLNFNNSKVVTEAFSNYTDEDSITEGIDISANGEVTFSFSPKKSFMDQYAENHRLLVENSKAGNYEAMKTNLAFLFAMISVIERDYIYGDKKVTTTKLEDAKKARVFAYNDFKTYIKEVQKHDKDFNFAEYYHEKGYDTITFTVNPDNVKGIKKLLYQICFGTFR